MEKTSTGLAENIASLLCYVLGWVSGIVFIIIERENKVVRFHAFQSIIVFGLITLIVIIFTPIPFLGDFIVWIVQGVGFVLWIALIVLAAMGKKYMLPYAGNYAEKWAGSKNGKNQE